MRDVCAGRVEPPIFDGVFQMTRRGIEGPTVNPIVDKIPKADSEMTFEEEVRPGFLLSLANWQRPKFGHPRLTKRLALDSNLDSQPREELDLVGGASKLHAP